MLWAGAAARRKTISAPEAQEEEMKLKEYWVSYESEDGIHDVALSHVSRDAAKRKVIELAEKKAKRENLKISWLPYFRWDRDIGRCAPICAGWSSVGWPVCYPHDGTENF